MRTPLFIHRNTTIGTNRSWLINTVVERIIAAMLGRTSLANDGDSPQFGFAPEGSDLFNERITSPGPWYRISAGSAAVFLILLAELVSAQTDAGIVAARNDQSSGDVSSFVIANALAENGAVSHGGSSPDFKTGHGPGSLDDLAQLQQILDSLHICPDGPFSNAHAISLPDIPGIPGSAVSFMVIQSDSIHTLEHPLVVYTLEDNLSQQQWVNINQFVPPPRETMGVTSSVDAGTNANLIAARLGYECGALTAATGPSAAMPNGFALGAAYPNPFNPTVTIPYELSRTSSLTMTVQNELGQVVKKMDCGLCAPGSGEVEIDMSGNASGFYFATLNDGRLSRTVKLLLLK